MISRWLSSPANRSCSYRTCGRSPINSRLQKTSQSPSSPKLTLLERVDVFVWLFNKCLGFVAVKMSWVDFQISFFIFILYFCCFAMKENIELIFRGGCVDTLVQLSVKRDFLVFLSGFWRSFPGSGRLGSKICQRFSALPREKLRQSSSSNVLNNLFCLTFYHRYNSCLRLLYNYLISSYFACAAGTRGIS